jgi:hypothetical protein
MHHICRLILILSAACVLLGGCAATPEASPADDARAKEFEPAPSTAIIYLYRTDMPGNSTNTVLYLDGRLVGEILPRTYFRVSVRPGINLLTAYASDNGRLELKTQSGAVYFVSISAHGDDAAVYSNFSSVPPETGRAQITSCCTLLEPWKPGQTRWGF